MSISYSTTRNDVNGGAQSAAIIDLAGDTQSDVITRLEQRVKWLEQELSQSQFNATHDELTGLPNRSLFKDRLDQVVTQAKRQRRQVGLLFLDIDGFKLINDRFGHLAGDNLLQQVAQRLIECTRDADTVGRVGGDEFMVLMPEVTGVRGPADLARKLKRRLAKPLLIDGHTLILTASIGGAVYPDDCADREGLIHYADTAMYVAKSHLVRSGKIPMQVFHDVGA